MVIFKKEQNGAQEKKAERVISFGDDKRGLTEEQKAFTGFKRTNKQFCEDDEEKGVPSFFEKVETTEAVETKEVTEEHGTEPVVSNSETVAESVVSNSMTAIKEEKLVSEAVVEKPALAEETVAEEVVDNSSVSGNSILEKLVSVAQEYQKLDAGVASNEVSVRYCDGVKSGYIKNSELYLPIRMVYVNGLARPFDSVGEVKVPMGAKVEVDFGTSFALTGGIGIQMTAVDDCENKFGLRLKSKECIRRQEALFPLVAEFEVVDEIAYVSKFQSIAHVKFVKLDKCNVA